MYKKKLSPEQRVLLRQVTDAGRLARALREEAKEAQATLDGLVAKAIKAKIEKTAIQKAAGMGTRQTVYDAEKRAHRTEASGS